MRVALVNPNTYLDDIVHPPIGLALLATICEADGHQVRMFDLPVLGMDDAAAVEAILETDPEVVGLTVTTKIYAGAAEISRRVKERAPQVSIVMGGPHPTFAGRSVLERAPFVDYIVQFEGEHSFPALLARLERGGGIESLAGLGFRRDGVPILNSPEAPLEDLDDLPLPSRAFFPVEAYLARDDETTVLGARGCPNRCAFCSTSRMGRTLRCRSPRSVANEVQMLLRLGFRSIFFADDTFTSSSNRVCELCEAFQAIEGAWRWTCNMRLQDANPKTLAMMAESGCYRVFVGVESGSAELLGAVNKRCPSWAAPSLGRIIQDHKIQVHASFVLGLPGETEKSLWNTVNLAKEMAPNMVSFNVMTPYPGTELYESPARYGLVMPDRFWFEKKDWFRRPVCGTKDISPERLRELAIQAYAAYVEG